jgi:hypothetical protein
MKIALVYDRINKWGGAERVLLALHNNGLTGAGGCHIINPQVEQWGSVAKE